MKTKTINLSLPVELLQETDTVAKKQYRTRSELMREALRRYVALERFEEISTYGQAQAKKLGMKPADINRIIAEIRNAKSPS